MLDYTEFLTIKRNSESLFKDKGSKHFGYSFRINSKEEAKSIIDQLRIENPKCNHVCYAYRLIENEQLIEFSTDDGEPSNSAGAPILGQLKSKKHFNTLVAVVRYFGGTKLGISGLINAYKTTAADVLDLSESMTYSVNYLVTISLDSKLLGTILSFLSRQDISIINQTYSNLHEITVHTNSSELERIKTKFGTIVQIEWEKK